MISTFQQFLTMSGIAPPLLLTYKAKEDGPPSEPQGWDEGPQDVCRKAEQLLNQALGEIRVRDGTGIKSLRCNFLCEDDQGVITVELTGQAVGEDATQVGSLVRKLVHHARLKLFRHGILMEAEIKKLFVSEAPFGETADLLQQFHFSVQTHLFPLAIDVD